MLSTEGMAAFVAPGRTEPGEQRRPGEWAPFSPGKGRTEILGRHLRGLLGWTLQPQILLSMWMELASQD